MTLANSSAIRDVAILSPSELELVRAFMQGAIYSWVKNRKDEPFAVRDLVGGENTDWDGTPLQALYVNHVRRGKTDQEAFDASAKDLGWIVKSLLSDDQRHFDNDETGFVNSYRWIHGVGVSQQTSIL